MLTLSCLSASLVVFFLIMGLAPATVGARDEDRGDLVTLPPPPMLSSRAPLVFFVVDAFCLVTTGELPTAPLGVTCAEAASFASSLLDFSGSAGVFAFLSSFCSTLRYLARRLIRAWAYW